jgi:hypothetical protein
VSLVILDSKEGGGNINGGGKKEKDLPPQVIKERALIERKINVFATGMWGTVSVITVSQSQRTKGYNGQQGQPDTFIVASEVPILILRELGSTIIKSYQHLQQSNQSQHTQNILEGFYSSSIVSAYKKNLKMVVLELSHIPSLKTPQATVNTLSSGNVSGTGTGAGGGGNPSHMNLQQSLRDVFLYSIIDDKFDLLSYSPLALTRAS